MEKQEILNLVGHNAIPASQYAQLRWISHPKNPKTRYYAYQVVSMHCDGEWHQGVLYSDGTRTFCRRADDFAKFSEVK